MIPSRFVFSQNFQILTSHGTFEKIVIKVQKMYGTVVIFG